MLLSSASISDPDATQPILASLPCTGRSRVHGDSRMTMVNYSSLVYTKVHPLPSSDHYRIPTATCIDAIQNPMSSVRSHMHVPKTLRGKCLSPGNNIK